MQIQGAFLLPFSDGYLRKLKKGDKAKHHDEGGLNLFLSPAGGKLWHHKKQMGTTWIRPVFPSKEAPSCSQLQLRMYGGASFSLPPSLCLHPPTALPAQHSVLTEYFSVRCGPKGLLPAGRTRRTSGRTPEAYRSLTADLLLLDSGGNLPI